MDDSIVDRITTRSEVFGGKPIIRDMRIAVEHVLGMIAAGDTVETILQEYPVLEPTTYRRVCFSPTAHRFVPVHGRVKANDRSPLTGQMS